MIKFLQKTILFFALLFVTTVGKSQTYVDPTASTAWVGYMNVYDLGNIYIFGNPWALPDLKTVMDVPNNTITLQPNFNTYDAASAFWANGAIGNKIMEGNTYIEDNSLIGQNLVFSGNVLSNTLSAAYSATAFIKVLDPFTGYTAIINQTVPLPGGPFTVSALIPNTAGLVVQYGFSVFGINANPITEAAVGSVVIGNATPLSLSKVNLQAQAIGNTVALNWKSNAANNVEKYIVEKSTNAVDFKVLETINFKGANMQYQNIDNAVSPNSAVYYKLKEVMQDGSIHVSNVEKVYVQSASLQVVPNPATNNITVYLPTANAENVTITNSFGTVLHTSVGVRNTKTIDVAAYAPGVYYISCGSSKAIQFVKQ